jgi:hypothetical protein
MATLPARPALLVAALLLVAGACGAAAPGGSPASAAPAAAGPTPVLTPVAGGPAAASGVPGAGLVPTEGEQMLLGGMRTDLQGACGPVREDLPVAAVAELGCVSVTNGDVEWVTVDLFDGQQPLLEAYAARLGEAGVEPMANGGSCVDVEQAEGPWIPAQDASGIAERGACWQDAAGVPMAMLTEPPFVLVTVTGTPGTDIGRVWRYAWLGNDEVPGAPTVWREIPVDDEK